VNPAGDVNPAGAADDAAAAVRNAHQWFETNSGWAPPDPETLADWVADGVCRCPDECLVAPAGWCAHGLASWWLILAELGPVPPLVPHGTRLDPLRPDYGAILAAHQAAVAEGSPGYADPATGLFVLTAAYLLERGFCCDQGCRHCPYVRP